MDLHIFLILLILRLQKLFITIRLLIKSEWKKIKGISDSVLGKLSGKSSGKVSAGQDYFMNFY